MRRSGPSRIEVLVIVAAAVVAIGFALPMLARLGPGSHSLSDAANLKQIQFALSGTAMERKGGKYPPYDGSHQDHVTLWSQLLACNSITPELLVSPNEKNSHVSACTDFHYDGYDPKSGAFAGTTPFACDLTIRCNTSYAALPLDKAARRLTNWRASLASPFIVLGSRGRRGGVGSTWEGCLCFADGHLESARAPFSAEFPDDNVFKNDTNALPVTNPMRNSDVFLVIQKDAVAEGAFVTEDSPEITWD